MDDPRSERTMLMQLCRDSGLQPHYAALRRGAWAVAVLVDEQFVWVEDEEDIAWLLVDMTSDSAIDRYIGEAA